MRVLKFGGTSIADAAGVQQISEILGSYEDAIVVVSAFGGVTDKLKEAGIMAEKADARYKDMLDAISERHMKAVRELAISREDERICEIERFHEELNKILEGVFLIREFSKRTSDLVLSFGERISARILTAYLKKIGRSAGYLDPSEIIITDDSFTRATIDFQQSSGLIRDRLSGKEGIMVVPGFIGSTEEGLTTTLGRGGSDLSATYIGSVIKAEEVQIWTDVNGFMTADPGKVSEAFSVEKLSYEEALELSYFGAKVLLPPAIRPAKEADVPILIKNTINRGFKGTMITGEGVKLKNFAKGITSIDNISLIVISGSGMVGVRGISARIFKTLADNNINAILISQASSEQSVCVAIEPELTDLARKKLLEEFKLEIDARMIDSISSERDLSIIAVVGDQMKQRPGVAGRLFNAFGEKGINVVAIAQGASELNISVVVSRDDERKALNVLHEAFFSEKTVLNVILAGVGLIGSELLEQIKANQQRLKAEQNLEIRVIALFNSRKILYNKKGIDLENWKEELEDSGQVPAYEDLIRFIDSKEIINNVFVDCTASEEVASLYEGFMKNRVSVVAANKIANTEPIETFRRLNRLANQYSVHYLYETNAGAGLPIIDTLRNLRESGDRITKIEAILSGTISFIFNSCDPETPLSQVVREAKEKGYTEPDPRTDLSGKDFARKLLLLSREIGEEMEYDDIEINPLLPERCMEAEGVEAFFRELEQYDAEFADKLKKAEENGQSLRWIGVYEDSRARIELKAIGSDHPFYKLAGSDNVVSIKTRRYENPLVIQGAGAGAGVTAAGVMADIFRVATAIKKRWTF